MNRAIVLLMTIIIAASLAISACASSQPAPTPTKTQASPGKSAEPAKAAATQAPSAAAPTAAAKKIDFPANGRSITIIVPYAPGGAADVSARVIAPLMEKELRTPVQVVNKAGANTQVGLTELVLSKPDGYTLGYTTLPTSITTYLDPERKAAFGRASFQPVGNQFLTPAILSVPADSPYKSLADLVEAAKAKPGAIKVATTGLLSINHLALLQLENVANVKFAAVHFDGGGPATTALLGKHVDALFALTPNVSAHVKSGSVRPLGVAERQEDPLLPGVKTMEAQGFKVYMSSAGGLSAPASTPKGVVDLLTESMKKSVDTAEHKTKMQDLGQTVRYMDPTEFTTYWEGMEKDIAPLMKLAK